MADEARDDVDDDVPAARRGERASDEREQHREACSYPAEAAEQREERRLLIPVQEIRAVIAAELDPHLRGQDAQEHGAHGAPASNLERLLPQRPVRRAAEDGGTQN